MLTEQNDHGSAKKKSTDTDQNDYGSASGGSTKSSTNEDRSCDKMSHSCVQPQRRAKVGFYCYFPALLVSCFRSKHCARQNLTLLGLQESLFSAACIVV